MFLICRNRTKNINVTEISRDIYKAERAQDKANDDLETASRNTDMSRTQVANVNMKTKDLLPSASDMFKHNVFDIFQMNNILYNIETKLMSRRPEDLQRKIRDTQTKTEQNRKMASDAREAADSALQNAADAEQVSGLKMSR